MIIASQSVYSKEATTVGAASSVETIGHLLGSFIAVQGSFKKFPKSNWGEPG